MPRITTTNIWRLCATVILAGSTLTAAAAQSRDPATEAQAIFTSVMSPYCPGLLLADCPSPAAFELRADIRRRLDAGEPRERIEADLYRTWGDSIRAVPRDEGWGRVLWLSPAIAFALSIAALMWLVARSRARPQPQSNGAAVVPENDERVQEELNKLA